MKKPNNADQEKYWSSPQGRKWIRFEAELGKSFSRFTNGLLTATAASSGDHVLDIGCGTGDTTLALAKSAGPDGTVKALDIAAPLLQRAQERADKASLTNISFTHGDAQKFAFEPEVFDILTSRFGVMFFAEPVTAFANMRTALKPNGRLVFACWSGMEDNPWFRIPRDVAQSHLGKPKPVPPRAPGPLAFAETDYVKDILAGAGYQNIKCETLKDHLLPEGGLDAAAYLASQVGMAQRIMFEFDATTEDYDKIVAGVREEFSQFLDGETMRVPAMVHLFQATP